MLTRLVQEAIQILFIAWLVPCAPCKWHVAPPPLLVFCLFVCLLVCPLTCSQALFLGLCQLPKHLIMNVLGMRPSEEGGGGVHMSLHNGLNFIYGHYFCIFRSRLCPCRYLTHLNIVCHQSL